MTTLDDLKRAIEKVERYKQAPLNEALHNAVGWCAAERDAWRTAFKWREALLDRAGGPDEYHEGMALIREQLK
jgi:hypothetical protein